MYNYTRSFWETGKYFFMNNLLKINNLNNKMLIILLFSVELII